MPYVCLSTARLPGISGRQVSPKQWKSLQHSSHLCRQASQQRYGSLTRSTHDGKYQVLLSKLAGLQQQQLEKSAEEDATCISIGFLSWLADREGQQLRTNPVQLAQQLLAIRQHLEQARFDQVQHERLLQGKETASVESAAPSKQEQPQNLILPTALQPTSFMLHSKVAKRQDPSLSLTPEGGQYLLEQAEELGRKVREAREQSQTALIGRKQFDATEAAQGLSGEARAAERILNVLLQIDERQERMGLLPDAFTPSEEPDDPQQDELLSTTPLQLLQAVDVALAQQDEGDHGVTAGFALKGEAAPYDVKARLLELRKDILLAWDGAAGKD